MGSGGVWSPPLLRLGLISQRVAGEEVLIDVECRAALHDDRDTLIVRDFIDGVVGTDVPDDDQEIGVDECGIFGSRDRIRNDCHDVEDPNRIGCAHDVDKVLHRAHGIWRTTVCLTVPCPHDVALLVLAPVLEDQRALKLPRPFKDTMCHEIFRHHLGRGGGVGAGEDRHQEGDQECEGIRHCGLRCGDTAGWQQGKRRGKVGMGQKVKASLWLCKLIDFANEFQKIPVKTSL